MNEIEKDCTNCLYFDIETFYGVCNKHAIILDEIKPCENYEECEKMNEIEKLYKLAKISREPIIIPSSGETIGYGGYPPFTAEKQLELIKWLLYSPKVDNLNMFYKNEENYLEISIDCKNGYSYENSFDDNFEIAIASAINTIWQDLTEKEKQQIKEILEKV